MRKYKIGFIALVIIISAVLLMCNSCKTVSKIEESPTICINNYTLGEKLKTSNKDTLVIEDISFTLISYYLPDSTIYKIQLTENLNIEIDYIYHQRVVKEITPQANIKYFASIFDNYYKDISLQNISKDHALLIDYKYYGKKNDITITLEDCISFLSYNHYQEPLVITLLNTKLEKLHNKYEKNKEYKNNKINNRIEKYKNRIEKYKIDEVVDKLIEDGVFCSTASNDQNYPDSIPVKIFNENTYAYITREGYLSFYEVSTHFFKSKDNWICYDACSCGNLEEAKKYYSNFNYIGTNNGVIKIKDKIINMNEESHYFIRKNKNNYLKYKF